MTNSRTTDAAWTEQRIALERARRETLAVVRELVAEERTLDSEREPEWEALAAVKQSADTAHLLAEKERARLAALNAALERIDLGTYGRCLTCGREIEPARLAILPEAPHCSDCARALH